MLITENNIDEIMRLPRCGINEYNNTKRIAEDNKYYKAHYVNGQVVYFRKFCSLARLINTDISEHHLQYRLKHAFESNKK